jgi:hypothetical protein
VILLKVLLRALAVSAVCVTAVVLLNLFGLWIAAILASVVLGLSALFVGAGLLDDTKNSAALSGFGGLVVVVAASLVSSGMIEEPLWPGTVSGLTLNEAGAHQWATILAFREGVVRTEWEGYAPVFGKYNEALDYAYVAPVVGDGWTRDQPIGVWAVARRGTYDERVELWKQPVQIGVRVRGALVENYLAAVKDARESYDLRSDPHPIFIEWTPTPEKSIERGWRILGNAIMGSTIALFSLALVARLFQ